MIFKVLSNLLFLGRRIKRRILFRLMISRFKKCGGRFRYCPEDSEFTYENITIGYDVHIGQRAFFMSTESEIIIGNYVMFGPNVTIIGGNHNTSLIGSYMISVTEKLPNNDLPVIIEDDVWVGASATILKGVTIGRGSIVSAGSVVTKSCPPYLIIGGTPAHLIKWRWSLKEIVEHETQLYSVENQTDIAKLKMERMAYKK